MNSDHLYELSNYTYANANVYTHYFTMLCQHTHMSHLTAV